MSSSCRIAALLTAGILALLGLAASAPASPPAIQNGGTLVVGQYGSVLGGFDPDRGVGFGSREVMRTFCETLYDVDRQGRTVPLLASGPSTVSKDKLTVTIPLRKGILFNDGTPFNAEAVATTFQRDITPGSARAAILGQVTSATASGPYTVQLHLSSPNTALAFGLTNEFIMSPAQLSKVGDNFGSDPVCVGPFMFDSQVAGQSVTVVRSPYYYDKQDVHLDKLVFQNISSDFGAAAALEAGDIQALDNVPREVLKAIEQHGFRIVGSLSFGAWDIEVNLGNVSGSQNPYSPAASPIASSPLLRNAFELAIDRKTLNKVVFGGTNLPGCTPLTPAAAGWYDPAIPCTPYDPAQARKLVQASGIADPTVQMLVPALVQHQVLAEFLQAEERAVGINLVLTPAETSTVGVRVNGGNYQTYLDQGGPVKADPDWLYPLFLTPNGTPQNAMGYSNPSLTLDLKNARKALSEQARRMLYRAAQRTIMDDRAMIFLAHVINRAAISNRLVGAEIRPDRYLRVAFAGYRAGT